MRPFTFYKPVALSQALAKKNSSAQFLAGGTNLLDLMKKEIAQPHTLVDLSAAMPKHVQLIPGGISIGAMATNSGVANHPQIKSQYPLITQAIEAGASPQIRNMASMGGNILQRTRCAYFYDVSLPCNKRKPGSGCSALHGHNRMAAIIGYSNNCVAVHPSDLCVALAALDAAVQVVDAKQQVSSIPFKDFHRLPGTTPNQDNNLPQNALIQSIEISKNNFNKHIAYVKLRERDSYAFALVSVAAALHIENNNIVAARLASGGVAHKPWRWYAAEKFLIGKPPSANNFKAAAELAIQDTKALSENAFKIPMLKAAIEVALHNCLMA